MFFFSFGQGSGSTLVSSDMPAGSSFTIPEGTFTLIINDGAYGITGPSKVLESYRNFFVLQ